MYFEIDSVLPVRPEFEFLRKSCGVKRDWLPGGEGFRLKTIKLRKQISQGLLIPISELGLGPSPLQFMDDGELIDYSDILGVVKWDPPLPATLGGKARGNFPEFIRKTDEERIQNVFGGRHWRAHKDDLYEMTMNLMALRARSTARTESSASVHETLI